MVDVKPSNEKLVRRCVTIVCNATGCDDATATAALEACGYRPKTAIVMVLCGVGAEEAKEMLAKADGRVAQVVEK
jgi:N-acetylmuramic acid 6-phosphate etherase